MSSELITKATENNNFPANYISFQPLRDASRYTMWTSTEALATQQKVEEWKMWANEASADGKHVKKVHSFNKGFALLRGPGRGEKKSELVQFSLCFDFLDVKERHPFHMPLLLLLVEWEIAKSGTWNGIWRFLSPFTLTRRNISLSESSNFVYFMFWQNNLLKWIHSQFPAQLRLTLPFE